MLHDNLQLTQKSSQFYKLFDENLIMQRIKTLYITNPEFCGIYTLDDEMYVLIGDIIDSNEFFCKAIRLNQFGKVYTEKQKSQTVNIKIIRK